jgi:integrase
LGVNAGFGNSDVGNLPLTALDLERALIHYPRPKTAIERTIPLWPETVQALRDWLTVRPNPARDQHAGLAFLTVKGDSWAKETSDNPVSKETAKLLKASSLNGHRNFYCLRHTFQTIADECGDFIAVRKIMGHASSDIAEVYRERISLERLRRVTDHVRAWLLCTAPTEEKIG